MQSFLQLGDKEAAKDFLLGGFIMAFRGERSLSCQVKKRRTVTMASVFKQQSVTRFSITVVEEKKVLKRKTNRGAEDLLVIFTFMA